MEPFFAALRQAREARRLTVADISNATLINERFLEAIERGDVTILPQTYIRAFLREYAEAVGLDPDDILHRYDQTQAGRPAVIEPPPPAMASSAQAESDSWKRRIVLLTLILAAVALILANTLFREKTPPLQEVPFQRVITENEQRAVPLPGTTPPAAAPTAEIGPADSLVLRGTTTDSVWVRLITDTQPPREYLFGPDSRFAWKARDRFVLTLGNAGGIQFALGAKQLGSFGRRGSVIRDTILTRRTLDAR